MSWEATYAFETFPERTLSIVISQELQIFVTDLDASSVAPTMKPTFGLRFHDRSV